MPPLAKDEQDRAIGCFLGLAVGDALGTAIEFEPRDATPPVTDMIGGGPFNLPAGYWTDDTSMAICLAESLLACGRLGGQWLDHASRAGRDLPLLRCRGGDS